MRLRRASAPQAAGHRSLPRRCRRRIAIPSFLRNLVRIVVRIVVRSSLSACLSFEGCVEGGGGDGAAAQCAEQGDGGEGVMLQRFQQGLFRFDGGDEPYGKGEDGFGEGAVLFSDELEQAQECCRCCAEQEEGVGDGVVVFAVEIDGCHAFCDVVLSRASFCLRVVDETLCVGGVLADGDAEHGRIAEDGDIFYGGCGEGVGKVFCGADVGEDFGVSASVDHADGEGLQGFGKRFDGAGVANALEREACDSVRLLRILWRTPLRILLRIFLRILWRMSLRAWGRGGRELRHILTF